MFVRRDAADTLDADRERTRRLVEQVRDADERGLRVWTPPRHVSFGRRDRREDGFERARAVAAEIGYPTAVRESGGRAVAFSEGTLAVVLATPTDGEREGIRGRYERAIGDVQDALEDCGVDADRGEPPDSFCPGSHSLQVDGRKVVGLAQRVRAEVAVLAGIVIVRNPGEVAGTLGPIYDAMNVPFDRDSVGALASGGASAEPPSVGDRITTAFTAGESE